MRRLPSVAVTALHCYFKISQDPNGPLLNTVPPKVIKAVNKIVKQASDKGGILKAQQQKYSVSRPLFLQIPAWGLGSPCGYDATSLLAIAILDWCALK